MPKIKVTRKQAGFQFMAHCEVCLTPTGKHTVCSMWARGPRSIGFIFGSCRCISLYEQRVKHSVRRVSALQLSPNDSQPFYWRGTKRIAHCPKCDTVFNLDNPCYDKRLVAELNRQAIADNEDYRYDLNGYDCLCEDCLDLTD